MKLQSPLATLEKTSFVTLSQTSLSVDCFFPRVFSLNKSMNSFRTVTAARTPYLTKKTSRKVQTVCLDTLYPTNVRRSESRSKKEVFQPHLPVRLPCYDLAPVTRFALGRSLRSRTSGAPDFHGLTGGVYKARERIHRAMADARLLANPASRSRVADSDPN